MCTLSLHDALPICKDKLMSFNVMPEEEEVLIASADVTDFELEPIQISAVPANIGFEDPDTEELTEAMQELSDAISEINEGVADLEDGALDLSDGASQLSIGSKIGRASCRERV